MKKLLSSLLILTMLVSSMIAFAAELPTDSLVAYWSFDEITTDGKVADLTGNGYDMTIDDASYEVINGMSRNSINFNGSAANYTGDNGLPGGHMSMNAKDFVDELKGSSAVTITGFMKKESLGHSANEPIVMLSSGNVSIKMNVTSKVNGEQNERITLAARSTTSDVWANVNKHFPVKYACRNGWSNASGWNAFAVVLDYANDKMAIYWDGVLAAEESVVFDSETFNYTGADTHMFYLCGQGTSIDEVKVYKSKLTEDQIKKAAGAAIEYDFEDICNGITDIASGNGNASASNVESITGVTGNAAKFGAAENIALPTSLFGTLCGAKAITFSSWLKLDNGVLPSAETSVLLGHTTQNNGSNTKTTGLKVAINADGRIICGARTTYVDSWGGITSDKLLKANDDNWHHIATTIDYTTKTLKVYFDGKLCNETTLTNEKHLSLGFVNGFIANANGNVLDTIGAAGVSMDSTKLYRRELSANEILELAQEMPFVTPEFSVSGTSITASMKIANQTGAEIEENKAVAILALYETERNTLKSVKIVTFPALAVGEKTTLPVTLEDGVAEGLEGQSVKLFVWDNFVAMNPYVNAFEYPNNN